mgnify:FL=1
MERKLEVVNRYGGRNLSKMLKISHPAVSKWKVIPPLRAYQIAEFGDFKASYIRPDLPEGYSEVFDVLKRIGNGTIPASLLNFN